ncbi:hypothetical protein vBPpSSYP_8 [Pseudomonas phage vB_PpS_SYP]|nr:hypothetical protein vBPpSSYP_8 [Pseudomonas phage vB_PpS_SYP]
MKTWKPTAEQAKEIRNYAKMRAGTGWVTLELGEKVNDEKSSANIMLLTADIYNDKNSFDQNDFIVWERFRKEGVPLASNGQAFLDFYVYDKNRELCCNINVCVLVDSETSIIVCGG